MTRSGAWLASARSSEHGAGQVELLVAGPRTSAVLELDLGLPCAGEIVLPEGVALEHIPTLLLISLVRGMNHPVTLERPGDRLGFRAVGLQAGEYIAQLMTTEASFSVLRFELPARGDKALELHFELQRADAVTIRPR